MEKTVKKSSPFSENQKTMMVEFMEQHPKLISGKFDSNFTYKKASGLWEELTEMLNAIPGTKKNWKNWRKTWHDMRTRTKGKQSKINRYVRGTGGGPMCDDTLNPTENKIVALIGNTAISGHTEVAESEVSHINTDSSVFNSEMSVHKEGVEIVVTSYENDNETLSSPTPLANISATDQTIIQEVSAVKTPAKRRMATQRLHRTISATEKLAEQCEKKLKIKEEYYKAKIKLIERELLIKERIAKALEDIASKIN